jgi:hypothetical protein
MLLAEALAARRDARDQFEDLSDRIAAAAVRYEDQDMPVGDSTKLVGELTARLDTLESLVVRINRTNNGTRLRFDSRDLSIMEAIALRQRLTLEAEARRNMVEAIEDAIGTYRSGRRGLFGSRRSKDDVRALPTVDIAAERKVADRLSETVRRLDLALQQKDWTTELLE